MSNPGHEPTMEEILASIRKIISEDGPENPPTAEAAPAPVHDDVLELTHEIVEPAPIAPAPIAHHEPAPIPVEDLAFETVAPAPAPVTDHSDIFSDHTRKAMEDAFDSIPEEHEPEPVKAPAPVIAPVDGSSVETVFERAVRESFEPVLKSYLGDNSAAIIERMKPAIREWMDAHFPALLEGAVRAEVERVVKSRAAKR